MMISGSGWRGGVEREDLLRLSQRGMALCVILTDFWFALDPKSRDPLVVVAYQWM